MNEINEISVDKTIENLLSIHPLITKSFNRAVRSKTNLNPGSLFILGLLLKHEFLSMTEIGCKLSMPKPHVTIQIDKLIADNMVERINDSKDRRVINIRMTEKGKADFQNIKKEISEELKIRIEQLAAEKKEELYYATNRIRDILSEIMTDSNETCKNKDIETK